MWARHRASSAERSGGQPTRGTRPLPGPVPNPDTSGQGARRANNLARQHAIDHDDPGADEAIQFVSPTDLAQDDGRVGAGLGSRVAGQGWGAGEPGRWASGGDEADLVVVAGDAEPVDAEAGQVEQVRGPRQIRRAGRSQEEPAIADLVGAVEGL